MSPTVTLTQQDCLKQLASIAGAGNVHAEDEIIVVAPGDTPQVAEILAFANNNGITITPAGSGTKHAWGNPVSPGIRLELTGINSLREHPWQDMTCTVDAGCTWATMQSELARHGQMVALDPLWPEQATVGGIVATNDGGALRLKYGGLRDLIIGMTVVLADGTIAKTGGKVVKNVAGYDLHKLMTGGYGTLGVITQVNFRLHPIETHAKTWSTSAASPEAFAAPLRALLDSQLTPSSIQLRLHKQQCTLDVRIAALPECMDEHSVRLQKIFSSNDLDVSGPEVWQARQQLFDMPNATVIKVSLLPSNLCAVTEELQQWAAKQGLEISIVAQANGLMTVAVQATPDATIALLELLRSRLKPSGGSVVVLQIPNEARSRIDVWGYDSNALPLMREIKHRFDPNRILNPGRFVANI